MRPSRDLPRRTNKRKIKCKGKRKKCSSKVRKSLDFFNEIPQLKDDDINETLRINKINCAQGKGAWKVMPKDSCEVLKDRRRRQAESERCSNGKDTQEDENQSTTKKKPMRKNKSRKNRKCSARCGCRRRRKSEKRPSRIRKRSVTSSTTTTATSS